MDEVQLREAAEAYRKFVAAREAMNAAIPAIDATPAERALYDERYRADHEAEREHFRTAILLAQAAPAILALNASGWREGVESAPKDRAVLLFNFETGEQAVCTHMTSMEDGEQDWIMARGNNDLGLQIAFRFREPTHWRPLPTPPAASPAMGEE